MKECRREGVQEYMSEGVGTGAKEYKSERVQDYKSE